MAFEPKNKEIKQALSDNKNEVSSASSFKLPMFKEETDERVKTFTCTMKPSIRKKLDIIAKENGYQSSSKFLSDFIDSL